MTDFAAQQPDTGKIVAALNAHFSDQELRSLCFELHIEYDDLPPGGRADKARDLVGRCERERRLPELLEAVLRERPHIPRHSLIRDTRTDQSPFKGLLAFQEEDEAIFYGRESLTTDLLARFISPPAHLPPAHLPPATFLALVGASGSGKSSVVRAGLIPALRRQTNWPIHLITPAAHPLETLAVTLTRESESVTAVTTLLDDLRRDPRSLHLYVRRLLGDLPNRPTLLLVIDQFEELFTLCKDEAEQKAFVENLVYAVHPETAGPTSVILTLRADFYSHCLQFASLHTLLEQQQKIVPAMTAVELRAAIEQPAARAGLVFEEGLVDLLLRDVGDEPGNLPLLSHVLLETWQRREGNRLTLAGYTAAGGVQGAIAKTAESTYQRLTETQQAIARNIFLRLTELGEGVQDTRRRASLDELLLRAANAVEVEAVLKLLADARLVTTNFPQSAASSDAARSASEDADSTGADSAYAEVAHEALIREWPTLRRWLDEDREGLRIHRQLTEDADEWEKTARDVNYLYRGGRLVQAREWAATPGAALNELEQAFLDAGLAQQQDELATAKAIAAREADAAHKLRQRAVFLRGALVIAAALAIVSFLLYGQSSRNAETARWNAEVAREQARISRSAALAAASQAMSNDQPMLSLLLSVEARRVSDTATAFMAINKSLSFFDRSQHTLRHNGSLNSAAWNRDASQILTWGDGPSGEGGTAVVWDAASGEREHTLSHEGSVNGAAWNGNESQILTWSDDGAVIVWDAASGEKEHTFSHKGSVNGAAWNRDASQILTWGDGPSGEGGTAVVWDAASGEREHTLSHEGSVNGAAWNGNESQILTWSDDGTAVVWNVASGVKQYTLSHGDLVNGAAWNGDENQILTWGDGPSGEGGTAVMWDAANGEKEYTLSHGDLVNGAAWNGNESQIMTWGNDGAVVVWNVTSGAKEYTLSHGDLVNGAAWNGDESQILTWSDDGTAVVWDAPMGEKLMTLVGDGTPVVLAQWNQAESRILLVTAGGYARLYYTDMAGLLAVACQYATRNLNWQEWQLYLPGQPYRQTCPHLPRHPSVPPDA